VLATTAGFRHAGLGWASGEAAVYRSDVRAQLVLLPSPLLGPAVWEPVAEQLGRAGWSAMTCAVPACPRTPEQVMRSFLDSLPDDGPLAMIPHSNAGLYIPGLVRERTVLANVFVDAALPPAEGPVRLVPAGMYDFLEERVDEHGVLLPWTQWWNDTDLDGLFPSRAVRDRVEAGQPRVPLSYFRESLPAAQGWDDTPNAYLAFGDTYADERRRAERRHWPVRTMPGKHLHMLIEPNEVAAAVTELLRLRTSAQLTNRSWRSPPAHPAEQHHHAAGDADGTLTLQEPAPGRSLTYSKLRSAA
jgi:hypothetical protein